MGSKYRIRAFGDEKSLGAAAMSPFLDERPAELMEALRCRDIAWWLADDIVLYVWSGPLQSAEVSTSSNRWSDSGVPSLRY